MGKKIMLLILIKLAEEKESSCMGIGGSNRVMRTETLCQQSMDLWSFTESADETKGTC